jgi:hypothetical protein
METPIASDTTAIADHFRDMFQQQAVDRELITDKVVTASGVATGHAPDKDPPRIVMRVPMPTKCL